MAWLRIDDGFASHPKLASLTDRQFRVWMRVLCYCARTQDPSVDGVALNEIKGLEKGNVGRFAELGLLDRQGQDYEVHDWPKYQPKDATNAIRQARWRSRRNAQRNDESNGESNASDRYEIAASPAGTRGKAPSRPVPEDQEQDQNPPSVRTAEASYADRNGRPDGSEQEDEDELATDIDFDNILRSMPE